MKHFKTFPRNRTPPGVKTRFAATIRVNGQKGDLKLFEEEDPDVGSG